MFSGQLLVVLYFENSCALVTWESVYPNMDFFGSNKENTRAPFPIPDNV